MTLNKFEEILRAQCNKSFKDLKNGKRKEKLLKRREKVYSMTDLIRKGKGIGAIELFSSCVKTFGHVLEKSASTYAKGMGADVKAKKEILGIKIDIVFILNDKTAYNLESKSNIELDKGKSEKAKEMLKCKHNVVNQALKCKLYGYKLVSKILVWTKPTAQAASKIVKKPLTIKELLGYKEYFDLFNVQINEEKFENMIQRVFEEEVEAYF